LAFKPNTDDMRDAPSLTIISRLQEKGATITAYDPAAMGEAKRLLDNVTMAEGPYDAIVGAGCGCDYNRMGSVSRAGYDACERYYCRANLN